MRARKRVDETKPYEDATLPDGSRLNVVIPPISLTGWCLTIRKHPDRPMTAEQLLARGTWIEPVAGFLMAAVRSRLSILVAGGTSTGKTTTLNVLGAAIQPNHRVITIEDTPELRFDLKNLVMLQARRPSAEGTGEVTIRDLVRNALRMRPDRLIVGEVRGGEALDMLQAMNTGHPGSLTTLHANSASDALWRLETMALMGGIELPVAVIRRQISSAIQLVVFQELTQSGERRVTEVAEIRGLLRQADREPEIDVRPVFKYHDGRFHFIGGGCPVVARIISDRHDEWQDLAMQPPLDVLLKGSAYTFE